MVIVLMLSAQLGLAQSSDSTLNDSTKSELVEAIENAKTAIDSVVSDSVKPIDYKARASKASTASSELEHAIEAASLAAGMSITDAAKDTMRHYVKGGSIDDILPFEDYDYISLYNDSYTGLAALKSSFGNYEVYMNGENHTFTESNARLWLKMIKYLHENAGMRNIMFEYGYSYGALVNRYLETGDTNLYNSLEKFAYIEYSQVLKDLREFNEELPEGEKLYFTGIDVERGVYPIVKLLSILLPPDSIEAPDSIALHTQSINSLAYYNDYKLDNKGESKLSLRYNLGFQFKTIGSLDMLHANFVKFEDEYKTYLGENFEEFKRVIYDNYLVRKKWAAYEEAKAVQEYIYRENYMHQRFVEEAAEHKGVWFGQFGRCHATQMKQQVNACEWFQFKSLTSRIENTAGGRFEDKVLSIAIIYENDRKLGPDHEHLEEHFDSYFEDIPADKIVLLDIEADSVLYKGFAGDYNYMFLSTHNTRGEVYADTYDYLDSDISDEVSGHMSIGFTNSTFDFTDLNSSMGNFPFNNTQRMYTLGGGGSLDEFGISYEVDLGIMAGQHNELSGSKTITLRGFSYMSYYLYDLAKNAQWLDLKLGAGFGYGNLTLREFASSVNTNFINTGFLGESKVVKHNNPAFFVGGTGGVEINIKWLKVGYVAKYLHDFSNKRWMAGRTKIEGGPNTSSTNLAQGFKIGVVF